MPTTKKSTKSTSKRTPAKVKGETPAGAEANPMPDADHPVPDPVEDHPDVENGTDLTEPFAQGPDNPDPGELVIAPPGSDVPVPDKRGNPDVDPRNLDLLNERLAPSHHQPNDPADVETDRIPPDKSTTKGSGAAAGETHQRYAAIEERVNDERSSADSRDEVAPTAPRIETPPDPDSY